MGALRLLLAWWVVAVHGEGMFGVVVGQAWVAVQSFFIISGFYMSLVLNEKYVGPGSARVFWGQRFFRLVPMYWIVLLFTLAVSGLAWGWWGHAIPPLRTWLDHHHALGGGTKAFLAAVNALLIGQNETHFLGRVPGSASLHWTTDFQRSDPPVWQFLAVPQAWSIELELGFYLLAPWLVRRPLAVLLSVAGASLIVRAVSYIRFGLTFDPWTYRFFPSELALFLLGSLAYRMYRAPWRARASGGRCVWVLFAGFFALTIALPFIPIRGQIKAWPYYALTTLTLPFLFAATRTWRWDRWIGELSYPIYLIHFLVIWIGQAALPPSWQPHLSFWAILGSSAASIGLLRCFVHPLEKWRAQRGSGKSL